MTKVTEHTIEVEKLTKRYGDLLAVNDISFNVRQGDVFALLGPNGAGKTTTVEIIDTIRTPTSGKVTLLGMDVTKKKLAFREAPCLEAVAGVEPATFARVIPRGVYRAALFHLSYTARRRAGAFTLGEWAPRVA